MSNQIEVTSLPSEDVDLKNPKSPKSSILSHKEETKSLRSSILSQKDETKSPKVSIISETNKKPEPNLPVPPKGSVASTPPDPDTMPPPPPHPKPPANQVAFDRPRSGQTVEYCRTHMMQQQATDFFRRLQRMLPDGHRREGWVYAAAYVFLFTLFILFRMSTLGFICIMVYTALSSMLALKYFGLGPLANQNTLGARR